MPTKKDRIEEIYYVISADDDNVILINQYNKKELMARLDMAEGPLMFIEDINSDRYIPDWLDGEDAGVEAMLVIKGGKIITPDVKARKVTYNVE